MNPRVLLLAWLLAPAIAAHAESRRYELDPVHTRIVFFVKHAQFSRAIGTFSGITGSLMFDPDDPAAASVEATIPIANLDLGDAKWRDKVLDPTFFNVKKFPDARFESSAVDATDPKVWKVRGELQLHGVTRPVELDVTFNRLQRHPLTLRNTAGFSARTTLGRAAFGMQKWKKLVGDEVEVLIEVEGTRKRDPGSDPKEQD
jgi:polyisoprenoid-binding protein YceI